ncbi:MAG: polysaccharide biosynthesis tyrosine autokinase [Candidatus Omnitrophota bacterium]
MMPSRASSQIPEQQMHLRDYVQIVLRRRFVIITFFIVLVTTVLIGTIRQTPIYEATATLLIEPRSPRVISVQEVTPMGTNDYYAYKDYYETQYRLIKSPALLKKTAFLLGMQNDKGEAIKKLDRQVKVKPVKNSQLVELSAESTSPEMAAKFANVVAAEYINQNLERNMSTSSEAALWLSRKIEEQRKKLRDVELSLQKYREENDINILPEMTGEFAIEEIKSEYAKAQAMLANYAQRYTNEHPKMVELEAQITSLKNKIQGLEDIDAGSKTMEYRVLERDVQSNKRMYEVLVSRFKEIDISSTLNINNISIVDNALVPLKPVKPNVKLNLILAIMMGIVGGFALGFFLDYLDTTIKSPEDVKDIVRANFLGAVPFSHEKEDKDKDKVVIIAPFSPIAEAYRSIRTDISQLMAQGEGVKSLLITSAEPQAGKTLTVSNLGIALSQRGDRVVLVDCDLRKPQLDKVFNLPRDIGVTEYLMGKVEIEEIIKKTDMEGVSVITSGKIPHNPSEILGGVKMKELMWHLKDKFDLVLVDSPPVVSVTDAVVLSDVADCMLQVVRSGRSPVQIVLKARGKLINARARDLGVILNGVQAFHDDYYNYYRYYHYYGQGGSIRKSGQTELFSEQQIDES